MLVTSHGTSFFDARMPGGSDGKAIVSPLRLRCSARGFGIITFRHPLVVSVRVRSEPFFRER